jgi:hypothetical protein
MQRNNGEQNNSRPSNGPIQLLISQSIMLTAWKQNSLHTNKRDVPKACILEQLRSRLQKTSP